jgi:Phage endonuclease I
MDSRKKSNFEIQMSKVLEEGGFGYEVAKIPFVSKGVYTPDFSLFDLHVECKGWFRPGDRKKYKAIRDCLPLGHELLFLLMKPSKPVGKGAKLTMAGWCDKEGFRWFDTPEDILQYATQGEWTC